jgi:cytidylate kinase
MIFTVAIDGPAAAGKGTISKAVAAHFGFAHLDTGLLYRAVGAKVLTGADPLVAAQTLVPADLDNANLRSHDVAQAASQIAVNAEVRAALVTFQQDFARRDGGAVLDGRDIGTVICPDARAKLFVTASADCRAMRRHKELQTRGNPITVTQVLADVIARDQRDAGRAAAPMVAAWDATVIDTSEMTIPQAVAAAIAHIEGRIA